MDSKRIPIKVNFQQTDNNNNNNNSLPQLRTIRLGEPQLDIRDRMNQRMREFEEESRKWREQFGSSMLDRPKMFMNFPEFSDLGSPSSLTNSNWPLSSIQPLGRSGSSSFFPSSIAANVQTNTNKSFIEEDNEGNKKHKLQIEVGDFKPNELTVRTEGRLVIVKGERELVAGTSTESKQFNREITVPEFVDPKRKR